LRGAARWVATKNQTNVSARACFALSVGGSQGYLHHSFPLLSNTPQGLQATMTTETAYDAKAYDNKMSE